MYKLILCLILPVCLSTSLRAQTKERTNWATTGNWAYCAERNISTLVENKLAMCHSEPQAFREGDFTVSLYVAQDRDGNLEVYLVSPKVRFQSNPTGITVLYQFDRSEAVTADCFKRVHDEPGKLNFRRTTDLYAALIKAETLLVTCKFLDDGEHTLAFHVDGLHLESTFLSR